MNTNQVFKFQKGDVEMIEQHFNVAGNNYSYLLLLRIKQSIARAQNHADELADVLFRQRKTIMKERELLKACGVLLLERMKNHIIAKHNDGLVPNEVLQNSLTSFSQLQQRLTPCYHVYLAEKSTAKLDTYIYDEYDDLERLDVILNGNEFQEYVMPFLLPQAVDVFVSSSIQPQLLKIASKLLLDMAKTIDTTKTLSPLEELAMQVNFWINELHLDI